ncbi:MAG: VanZ family protein [Terriglobia bacterium]
MRRFLRSWLPVVLWAAVISGLSTSALGVGFTRQVVAAVVQFFFPDISSAAIALVNTFLRKGAHVAGYFVLGFLLWRALRADASARWHGGWAAGAFLLTVAFGGLDEFHQSFEPGRTGAVVDVGFDAAGAALALLWVWWRAHASSPATRRE